MRWTRVAINAGRDASNACIQIHAWNAFRCSRLAGGIANVVSGGRRKVFEWMLERERATFPSQAHPRHHPDLPTSSYLLSTEAKVAAICIYMSERSQQDQNTDTESLRNSSVIVLENFISFLAVLLYVLEERRMICC